MTWKETFSGRRLDLLDPDPAQITLDDIAKGLSGINRFTGHTSPLESVAQHSIYAMSLVEGLFPEDFLLQALTLSHDAHEAYTGDISRPMKLALRALGCEGLDFIESTVQRACLVALGLPQPTDGQRALIKNADTRMLVTERRALMPNTGAWRWSTEAIRPDPKILALLTDPLIDGDAAHWGGLFEFHMQRLLSHLKENQ
jgi:hypothetical protein